MVHYKINDARSGKKIAYIFLFLVIHEQSLHDGDHMLISRIGHVTSPRFWGGRGGGEGVTIPRILWVLSDEFRPLCHQNIRILNLSILPCHILRREIGTSVGLINSGLYQYFSSSKKLWLQVHGSI